MVNILFVIESPKEGHVLSAVSEFDEETLKGSIEGALNAIILWDKIFLLGSLSKQFHNQFERNTRMKKKNMKGKKINQSIIAYDEWKIFL